jgi:hypothetical protein
LFRSPLERRPALPTLLLTLAFAATAFPAAASAGQSATSAYQSADRAVVSAATRLAKCEGSAPTILPRCASLNAKLQSTGRKLSAAQHRLPTSARTASSTSSRLKAPTLTVSGTKLSWNKVADVTTYVVVAQRSGKADQYAVVNGTTTTPAAVAGATLKYSVRTAVTGSAWSKTGTVTYPNSLDAARRVAPVLHFSGQTLSWAKVADVTSYEFVTKVPGTEDHYDLVNGTSVALPAHPGKTVRYGLRANVTGSAWASEVSVTFPAAAAAPAPTQAPAPASGTAPVSAPAPTSNTPDPATLSSGAARNDFQQGLVSGSAILWQLPFMQTLGTKHVRMEFDINSTVSSMTPILAAYAKAGIKPLLLATFNGRTPTDAEARNLATWAAAFGPNGTARGSDWAAGTAVTEIEYGNESNQPWQYASLNSDPNWPSSTAYANLATAYALTFKTAATSVAAANNGVGLLAIADTPGREPSWTTNVYKAVPNFATYVKGWVMHPYGPGWQLDIDDALAKAAAHGASNAIPIYVTEFGFATDNGRCLTDNYGWDKCMTYDGAASTLRSTISAMRARYASRLAALYLYSASDLNNSGATTDREAYFGALKLDRGTKGSYTTEVKAELAASA